MVDVKADAADARGASFRDRVDWLELVVGFSCNCRCRMCPSALVPDPAQLSLDDMGAWLLRGRDLGARHVWFGGGEPSLHPQLIEAIRLAKRAGYERIRLQTNGLRLSYPAYSARLQQAGLTEVSLSIKGGDGETHDGISRVPGAHDRVLEAARVVHGLGLQLLADVLLSEESLTQSEEIVSLLRSVGVEEFTFWLMSLHGLDGRPDARALLPGMDAAARSLTRALDRADALGVDGFSLHLPPCALPERHRAKYRHAGTYKLLVVVPGSDPFMAEDSPMEGGHYQDACGRCAWRSRCLGLRAEQLAEFRAAGFGPIDPGADDGA